MAGGKDNLPAFHGSVEGIAGNKSKFSPDEPGKNHLPLTRNAGLHGKNILPYLDLNSQPLLGDNKPLSTAQDLKANYDVLVVYAKYRAHGRYADHSTQVHQL